LSNPPPVTEPDDHGDDDDSDELTDLSGDELDELEKLLHTDSSDEEGSDKGDDDAAGSLTLNSSKRQTPASGLPQSAPKKHKTNPGPVLVKVIPPTSPARNLRRR
jgi:hypothetical protein